MPDSSENDSTISILKTWGSVSSQWQEIFGNNEGYLPLSQEDCWLDHKITCLDTVSLHIASVACIAMALRWTAQKG